MSIDKVLAEILSLRAEVASLKAMLGSNTNTSSNVSVASDTSSKGKGKDGRKKRVVKKDENGKAILSDWTRFTQRVSSIMKDLGFIGGTDSISHASSLKGKREDYINYTDDEIKDSLKDATYPLKAAKQEKPKKETKAKGKGKNKETKVVAANNISSPGDDEETTTTSNVASSSSSALPKVEMDYGGDDSEDDDEEAPQEPEETPIVFKGKKYWHNLKSNELFTRDAEDNKGDLVGHFIAKDPQTGKARIEPLA